MKPTKIAMLAMAQDPLAAIEYFRPMMLQMDEETREHWAAIETFIAIGLRVMAKTNPSKIRSEAMTVELSTLIPKERP